MATGPGSGARPHVRPLGAMLAAGMALALAVLTGTLEAYGVTPLEPRVRVDLVSEPRAGHRDTQQPRSATVDMTLTDGRRMP